MDMLVPIALGFKNFLKKLKIGLRIFSIKLKRDNALPLIILLCGFNTIKKYIPKISKALSNLKTYII